MRQFSLLIYLLILLPVNAWSATYSVSNSEELKTALADAQAAGGDNVIELAVGTWGPISFSGADGSSLTLIGAAESGVIIRGLPPDPLINFDTGTPALYLSIPSGRVRLQNIEISNTINSATISASVTELDNVQFLSNSGWALQVRGTVSISNSVFRANRENFLSDSVSSAGAAIKADVATELTIVSSVFSDNEPVFCDSLCSDAGYDRTFDIASLEITGSTFENNLLPFPASGLTTVLDSEFIGNTFKFYDDWIYRRSPSLRSVSFSSSRFDGNTRNEGALTVIGFNGNRVLGTSIYVQRGSVTNNVFTSSSVTLLSTLDVEDLFINNNLFVSSTVQASSVEFREVSLANNAFVDSSLSTGGVNPFYKPINLSNNYLELSGTSIGDTPLQIQGNIFEGAELGFQDADQGDYRLTDASDLIDAGSTDEAVVEITDYDFTGVANRLAGASIDIGPYEYQATTGNPDDDNDGVFNADDNCPAVANADQRDTDLDGTGDACDDDDDNDGVNDDADDFPLDSSETTDTDGDGIGNNADTDDDNDGFTDLEEVAAGTDPLNPNSYPAPATTFTVTPSAGTGGSISPSTPQTVEEDATTSFTLTPNSGYQIDAVGGTCNGSRSGSTYTTAAVTQDCTVTASFVEILDLDSDGDGVNDEDDAFPDDPNESVDTDGDGIGNNADTDDDNDGYSDEEEVSSGSDPLDASSQPEEAEVQSIPAWLMYAATLPTEVSVEISASGDDGFQLYLDGQLIMEDFNWKVATRKTVTLKKGNHVVAVKGTNAAGGVDAGAIIVDLLGPDFRLASSSDWEVSLDRQDAWNELGGILIFPVSATEYGAVDSARWWNRGGTDSTGASLEGANFPLNSPAKWIWSSGFKTDAVVYFRKEFVVE